MLTTRGFGACDAIGVTTTKPVAASAAAAKTYGRETACIAPPFPWTWLNEP